MLQETKLAAQHSQCFYTTKPLQSFRSAVSGVSISQSGHKWSSKQASVKKHESLYDSVSAGRLKTPQTRHVRLTLHRIKGSGVERFEKYTHT